MDIKEESRSGRNWEIWIDIYTIDTIYKMDGLLRWFSGKESAGQCRCQFDLWVRKTPGEGDGNPLQYSCLENPMDRGAWRATVQRVTKSWTRLSTAQQQQPGQASVLILPARPLLSILLKVDE